MLSKVNIKNFKSIRDLEFSAKRVNIFIGEPNTGKSNLIEALGVFSEGIYDDQLAFRDVLRFKTLADLFFERDIGMPARVLADGLDWSLKFESPHFTCSYLRSGMDGILIRAEPSGKLQVTQYPEPASRFYRFRPLETFTDSRLGTLRAPYGSNLVALVTTNRRLRRLVSDLFQSKGFRLVIDQEKGELSMAKVVDDEFYNFSYPTISETLRRIVFLVAIIETNKDAVLLLDEPEAHTFPFYTTHIAERIGLDQSNQFFITTHNPYLLSSVVEKTPIKDLNVFVTTMENFETNLKRVPDSKLPELLELDSAAFFNLDRLTQE